MGRSLFLVLAFVVMLGQTYSRTVDVDEFLNQVIENHGNDVDVEQLIQDEILAKHDDLESLFEEDMEAAETDLESVDDLEIEPDEMLGGCRRGRCKYCVRKYGMSACVVAEYLRRNIGFRLTVTLNGRSIYRKEISVRNPPPVCINRIPWLRRLGNVCIRVYNVDLRRKRACVRIEFKIKIGWFKKTVKLRIACFKIPILAEDEMLALNEEPIVNDQDLTFQ